MNEVKPRLSDEQIWQLAAQEGDVHDESFIFNRDGRWSVLSFARAIEAALSSSPSEDGGEPTGSEAETLFDIAMYGDRGNPAKMRREILRLLTLYRHPASPPPQGTGDAIGLPGTPNDQQNGGA
jgi:hypothetical protein